jgi:hypothetical protein
MRFSRILIATFQSNAWVHRHCVFAPPSSGFATFSPRKKPRGEKALDWRALQKFERCSRRCNESENYELSTSHPVFFFTHIATF